MVNITLRYVLEQVMRLNLDLISHLDGPNWRMIMASDSLSFFLHFSISYDSLQYAEAQLGAHTAKMSRVFSQWRTSA